MSKSVIIVITFILLTVGFSYGEVINTLTWNAPTETTDNKPIVDPIMYRLYACDAPITDDKTCSGDMQTLDTQETEVTFTYRPPKRKGIVYYRVSAMWVEEPHNESDLSNMVSDPFDVRGVPAAPASLLKKGK
jgi:hypothetical protein